MLIVENAGGRGVAQICALVPRGGAWFLDKISRGITFCLNFILSKFSFENMSYPPYPIYTLPFCIYEFNAKKTLRFKRLIVIIITISGFKYFRKRQLQLSADQQGADPEVRRLRGQRQRDGGRGWRSAGWRDDPGKRDGVLRPLRLLRQVLSRRRGLHLLRLASVKSRTKSEA